MSGSQHAPGVGTAYFPETDLPRRSVVRGVQQSRPPRRLRGLPRRRRPAMIALAVAMAGAGVVISAAIYQHADHAVPVVMVARAVPAGTVITSADLAVTRVATSGAITLVPASQLTSVTGRVAAVPLRAPTLLSPSELTTQEPPQPGQDLVAIAVRPSGLPASGLLPGDHVLVAATAGDGGQAAAPTGTAALAEPVPGVVQAVRSQPDTAGFDVVDLIVSETDAVAVASQVSTGQFALIVTKRGS